MDAHILPYVQKDYNNKMQVCRGLVFLLIRYDAAALRHAKAPGEEEEPLPAGGFCER